jgi:hypothetical protein
MGRKTMVVEYVHGSQAISVVESMNPAPPTKAASGDTASVRRNQYIAGPAAATFKTCGSVSPNVGGSTQVSHVSGKNSAVCGLDRNGTPP